MKNWATSMSATSGRNPELNSSSAQREYSHQQQHFVFVRSIPGFHRRILQMHIPSPIPMRIAYFIKTKRENFGSRRAERLAVIDLFKIPPPRAR